MTFMVLFIALVESAAIYGLIIAFQIIGTTWVDSMLYVGAGAAVWFAGLWVWIWEWLLAGKSIEIMWKNPRMIGFLSTTSILWVALVESAVIYALIVASQILSMDGLSLYAALGAGFAIWLAGLGAWVWEWVLIQWAVNGINTAPENKGKILAFMVLFVALVEVVAIYGLIIAFKVLG
jgi:F0F1-type ATP synthase membrane subunit c/vacuolar-type H+-ATPase subunit K